MCFRADIEGYAGSRMIRVAREILVAFKAPDLNTVQTNVVTCMHRLAHGVRRVLPNVRAVSNPKQEGSGGRLCGSQRSRCVSSLGYGHQPHRYIWYVRNWAPSRPVRASDK
ncbi:uncharacterized protein PgNI_00266 [Pyricularia grisea]|uniref:Uncharacterized protein n=1 Tax=Pyricularia grisea TaxID=148305 RepID=A0A6P8BGM3_PYRGI|nr:uncharacterized protein PgNI_00266 [Pyricularia grisea]TLD16011.1 hypothetical protein PgNI_00266 [Pyricularia grisea]